MITASTGACELSQRLFQGLGWSTLLRDTSFVNLRGFGGTTLRQYEHMYLLKWNLLARLD
jgi:hypothetical protein